MASPFPGMDPYLEDPAFWRDFHHEFVSCWRQAIADRLPEQYEARLDECVNLVRLTDDEIKKIYPDVAITRVRSRSRSATKARAGTLLMEPTTIAHEWLDEEQQVQIKILHRPDRKLIAVLELLSPTNKNGAGVEEYRLKRHAMLAQRVHLVELDLLLAGTRPSHLDPLPAGDYFVYLSRAGQRSRCEVYPWTVRDPLPTIPIPLKAPDADVSIDLGEVFRTTYERGRYARSLAYGKKPLAPLHGRDAKWAMGLAAERR